MKKHDDSPHVPGGALVRHRHICAFFNGIDEQLRVLRSFIEEGLERGEKTFHLVEQPREHLRLLAKTGIDVEGATSTGQLEVRPWLAGPLRGERFDQDTWLASFEEVLQAGSADGYARTRFLSQMEWALADMPGIDDLIELETRINDVVPRYDATVICAFDLAKFPASVVIDAMRTHPVVIVGGLLHENPFFVSPDRLLLELRERRSMAAGVTP
jgi:hypothetical protein